jgi:hypothetical protein
VGDGFILIFALIVLGLIALAIREFNIVARREKALASVPSSSTAKALTITIIVALAAASFAYRWLVHAQLEQTSALFIGIPTLLSILVVLAGKPKSTTGMLCMVTALALLISGIFLGEGFICILMAAPLFFGIAVLIGGLLDAAKLKKRNQTTMSCLLLLFLVPMSLEGVRPHLSFPREETVMVEQETTAAPATVQRNLGNWPQFTRPLPAYLRLGFPHPVGVSGRALKVGDRYVIHFGGGEGKPGDLILQVAEWQPGSIRFRAVSDGSHLAHWLIWRGAEVQWWEESPGKTHIRWTLGYRRSLDPAWYFGPWEKYGVTLAGRYLIETATTPARN